MSIRIKKCRIDKIINDEKYLEKINDTVYRINHITSHVYMFIRYYVIYLYHAGHELPIIDVSFVKMAKNALTTEKSKGRNVEEINLNILNKLRNFYDLRYKRTGYIKVDGSYLSHAFHYESVDMVTNINNNIILNYDKYINKLVNVSWYSYHSELIDNAENGTKTQKRKDIKNQINLIKKDLKSPSADVLQSDNHYHEWIKLHKPKLYPVEHVNFGYNIEKISEKPQMYLKPMIYICLELEKKYKICPYQFLPLRKSLVPKSITIDTSVLVDLFCENKNDHYKEIESHKEQLWNTPRFQNK